MMETYDQETEDRILGELEELSGYRDLSMESKIDLMETIREAQGNYDAGRNRALCLFWH